MVSIHRPLGYGPSTLPLRHSASPEPCLPLPSRQPDAAGHCWPSLLPFLSARPPPPHKIDPLTNSSPFGVCSTAPGPGLALLPHLPLTALHSPLPFDTHAPPAPDQRTPAGTLLPWAFLGMRAPEIHPHILTPAALPTHTALLPARWRTAPAWQFTPLLAKEGHGLPLPGTANRKNSPLVAVQILVPQLNAAPGFSEVKALSSGHLVPSRLSS